MIVDLGVVNRGERVAIRLLLVEVGTHLVGISLARERTIRARLFGDAVDPVTSIPLHQQPCREARARLP
ncbi:hypothetical protein [Sphingomonas molluscorum]|uniref:hypothetical protein n=1 Tax=Sphingomonas molluscorum TaxID=418184 RepID=UPI00234AC5BC